jgi:hypothetical protein
MGSAMGLGWRDVDSSLLRIDFGSSMRKSRLEHVVTVRGCTGSNFAGLCGAHGFDWDLL